MILGNAEMLTLHKVVLAANSLAGLVKPMELRFILTKRGYGSTP